MSKSWKPATLNRQRYRRAMGEEVGRTCTAVEAEVIRALTKHGSMNSAHEAYAVIREEIDEFWDEVRARQPDDHRRVEMRKELIQTAAMCVRAIVDLELSEYPE